VEPAPHRATRTARHTRQAQSPDNGPDTGTVTQHKPTNERSGLVVAACKWSDSIKLGGNDMDSTIVGALIGAAATMLALLLWELAAAAANFRQGTVTKVAVPPGSSGVQRAVFLATDPQPFVEAMNIVIKGFNSGRVTDRKGAHYEELSGKGVSRLRDKELRGEMEKVVTQLQRIRDAAQSYRDTRKYDPELDNGRDLVSAP
jgi:hypothetical protein